MGEDTGAVSASEVTAQPAAPEDPQQLREDIERTRTDLGDTVAALAEKTDVKTRAKDKAAEVRRNVSVKREELMGRVRQSSADGGAGSPVDQARAKAQENPLPFAAAGGFVAGSLLGWLVSRG